MATPQTYLAFAPQGVGLLCAVVYFEEGNDVYGWWTGARNSHYACAFFKLEGFFSVRDPVFYATEGTDVYGGWRFDYSAIEPRLDKSIPVPDTVCHRLDQLQGVFFSEWLFYSGDPGAEEEINAYRKAGLPVQEVNVKHKRLNKLAKGDVVWSYRSHDLDWDVIEYLMRRWPLDHRGE